MQMIDREIRDPRLSDGLRPRDVRSLATALPAFVVLESVPSDLGFAARLRLEAALGAPIASVDAEPFKDDMATGQRSGFSLGDMVGREKEFTRNLPRIKNTVKSIAEQRGVDEAEIWDEILDILVGSGMGNAMHRTLDKPLEDDYELKKYIEDNSPNGITFILREPIANWGARREVLLESLLGGLSQKALANVQRIIYAGSDRQYNGPELWRPELLPYIKIEDDKKVCLLTEYGAAIKLHKPSVEKLIGSRAALNSVEVHAIELKGPGVSGDEIMRAIANEFGERMKGNLVIEVGNAPAGYIPLAGGVSLSRGLGANFDPSQQLVMVTDPVMIVHPDHFMALDLSQRSQVQNAATALDSINGWLAAIVGTNAFMLERSL